MKSVWSSEWQWRWKNAKRFLSAFLVQYERTLLHCEQWVQTERNGNCKTLNDDRMANACWAVGKLTEKGKKNVSMTKPRAILSVKGVKLVWTHGRKNRESPDCNRWNETNKEVKNLRQMHLTVPVNSVILSVLIRS